MADPTAPSDTDGSRLDDEAVEQRLVRVDELLERVEQMPGPTTDAAIEAVQILTEIYGEALSRMLAHASAEQRERCVDDQLLRHLMVLHEIHPDTVEQRVRRVLDDARPHLESQGGQVELVEIEAGVARLRIATGGGGCGSCSSSADPVDEALVESVLALAPELSRVEPVHDGRQSSTQAVIPVEALLRRPAGIGGGP